MEGVTGTMARLSHVPGCSRAGLYGPANIDFRFVSQLRLQRAGTRQFSHETKKTEFCPRAPRSMSISRTLMAYAMKLNSGTQGYLKDADTRTTRTRARTRES